MALRGASRDRVLDGLRSHTEFKNSTGSMRGVTGSVSSLGYLPDSWANQYRADNPKYTVMSYDTPIAWVTAGGLVRVPPVKYSVTTSQHQAAARHGLNA